MYRNQPHSLLSRDDSLSSGRASPPPDTNFHTLQPAKKQSKWSNEENALIIELRGKGIKWGDVAKHLPGRSAISCRLHYQNYLERRSEWDEERKSRLALLYDRFKAGMWARVAKELQVPWRAAEAMHWQLGEHDMARRAGQVPFHALRGGPNSEYGGHAQLHSQGSVGYEVQASSLQPPNRSRPPSFMYGGEAAMPVGIAPPHLVPPFVDPVPQSQRQLPLASLCSGLSYEVEPHILPPIEQQPQQPRELPGVVQVTTSRAPSSGYSRGRGPTGLYRRRQE